MQLQNCSRHTTDLMSALAHRGLSHLIYSERNRCVQFAKKWLNGSIRDPAEFNPYVVATLEVNHKATLAFKLNLTRGGRLACPFCIGEANEKHFGQTALDRIWINNISDLMLEYARGLGVLRQ